MDGVDIVIVVVAVFVAVATIVTLPGRRRSETSGQWRGLVSPTVAAAMTLVGMVLIVVSVLLR